MLVFDPLREPSRSDSSLPQHRLPLGICVWLVTVDKETVNSTV